MKVKVIVSDVESRKGFDLVNILQNVYHLELILFTGKDDASRLKLIYGSKVFRLRTQNYESFESDFNSVISTYNNDPLVYIPVAEKTTVLFYQFIENYSFENIYYCLPSQKNFKLAANKIEFQAYCEQESLPVPKSFEVNSQRETLIQNLPLIAKPKTGAGSVGIKHIENEEQLAHLDNLSSENYLLQEKIQSDQKVSGVFFMCKNGQVLASYCHQRIRTFPTSGGVTVYSKSTPNDDIVQIGAKLLASLDWDGLAMIEFLQDKNTKDWKIIELNPRLWGSVLLSEFACPGFLKTYIDESTGKEVQNVSASLTEKFIRWYFPFEILNLINRDISLKNLLTLDIKNTCYINFTYSNWRRSTLFMLYFLINISSIKRFLKKIF